MSVKKRMIHYFRLRGNCYNISITRPLEPLEPFHKAGKTHGSNATVERGGSLTKIRDEDIAHYESLLQGDHSVLEGNKYKNIDAEAQKCLDKIDSACKEKIKKGLKEMKNENPNTFINKVIDNCLNPEKKKKKKKR